MTNLERISIGMCGIAYWIDAKKGVAMDLEFAYSLNGEHYRGAYGSREEALAEGLAAARRGDDSPLMVYVARRVPGDSMASGHARSIVTHMASRARERFEDGASAYLARLSRQQVDNLDKAVTQAIAGWLESNRLTPTFYTYEAISQHPVSFTSIEEAVTAP
jgi:hypothetical protein